MGELATRRPTGKPSWPILLLAGREGAGKSWAAVAASASPMVGRTLYLGIGEDDPDEYALIPGADFEIVEHDGTYPGYLRAVRGAVAEPWVGDKPTLLIIDSGTRLWNLIGDNMQAIANARAKGRKNAASGDYTISTDLWNTAASQWQDVMDALREHRGPVIITARLDPVTVMDAEGRPTKEKDWKIQAHKSLPFDASAIIEMRERGQFRVTKVKSARVQLEEPKAYPDFTVNGLWGRLGLEEGTSVRTHATVRADRSGREPAAQSQPQGAPQVQSDPLTPQQRSAPAGPPESARRAPTKDWFALAKAARSRAQLRPIYHEAEAAGDLDIAFKNAEFGKVDGAPEYISLGQWFFARREALPERAPAQKAEEEPKSAAPDAWAPVEGQVPAEDQAPVTEWETAQPGSGAGS